MPEWRNSLTVGFAQPYDFPQVQANDEDNELVPGEYQISEKLWGVMRRFDIDKVSQSPTPYKTWWDFVIPKYFLLNILNLFAHLLDQNL